MSMAAGSQVALVPVLVPVLVVMLVLVLLLLGVGICDAARSGDL